LCPVVIVTEETTDGRYYCLTSCKNNKNILIKVEYFPSCVVTDFHNLRLSGINVAPTSLVRTADMLLLVTVNTETRLISSYTCSHQSSGKVLNLLKAMRTGTERDEGPIDMLDLSIFLK
jgi:hypothetical protein